MRPRPAPTFRLFGLVAAREQIDLPPRFGVRFEPFEDLAAVLAEQPSSGLPAAATDTHRAIVAGVFAHCTILPAPPGTLVRSIAVLHQWLDLHHAALLDGLSYVDGRAEARVHVRRAPAPAEAPLRSPAGSHAGPSPVAHRDLDAATLDRVATQMFHELGREQPAWVISTVVKAGGSPTNAGTRPTAAGDAGTGSGATNGANNAPVATARAVESRARDDGDVSASFLVDRSRWRAFVDAVAAERQRASALDIRLTGPWPPYDFVRLQFGG